MFPLRFFNARFFPTRYFPKVGDTPAAGTTGEAIVGVQTPQTTSGTVNT